MFNRVAAYTVMLIRIRALFTRLTEPLRNLLAVKAHQREYGSQRMCPFCGLITSRSKSSCLECGKSARRPKGEAGRPRRQRQRPTGAGNDVEYDLGGVGTLSS